MVQRLAWFEMDMAIDSAFHFMPTYNRADSLLLFRNFPAIFHVDKSYSSAARRHHYTNSTCHNSFEHGRMLSRIFYQCHRMAGQSDDVFTECNSLVIAKRLFLKNKAGSTPCLELPSLIIDQASLDIRVHCNELT